MRTVANLQPLTAAAIKSVGTKKAVERAAALDRHYLSRLVSKAGAPGSVHQAIASEGAPPSSYTTTMVTGRRANESERIRWMFEKLQGIHEYKVYIVDDPDTDMPHLKKNHGREAAVYLSYIVDNYHNLTDISFFWHNDEQVWHNNMLLGASSVQSLNRMDRDNIMRKGYVPSRCDHWPGCPSWIRFNPSKAEHTLDPHRLEEMFNQELFSQFFPGTTDFPPYFAGTCCSQFAVSRDAIHSRPLDVYQRLLDWATSYEEDEDSGRVFEFSWPYIFTGRGAVCPSMQECYCQTYNFCMENPSDIEDLIQWNDLRTRREEVKWQVDFIESALETRQQELESEGGTEDEVVALEAKFQPEIERLHAELEKFVNSTWQIREDIVHKWKLPPPPVGW